MVFRAGVDDFFGQDVEWFEQRMAACEQADERFFDQLRLADDDLRLLSDDFLTGTVRGDAESRMMSPSQWKVE
jgi:hypothetical protein